MNDDPVDIALHAAGARMRAVEPDEPASHEALSAVLERELPTPTTPRRVRRGPLLFAGIGLAAAAVIALLVFGTGDEPRTIEQVPATQPDPSPLPTVEGTVAEPEATVPQLEPSVPPTAPPTVRRPTCDGLEVPPADEILACRSSADAPAAIVRRGGATPSFYATGTDFTGGPVELASIEIPGVAGPGFVAEFPSFGGTADPDSRCLVVLLAGSEGWSEACGPIAPTTAGSLVGLDGGRLVQIDIDDAGVPARSRDLSEGIWPASGCDVTNATQIAMRVVERFPGAVIGELRCDGESTNSDPASDATAVVSVGSTFLQGPLPDGSLVTLDRRDGAWTITDAGTGIDARAWPVPPSADWMNWPGDTAPAGGPDAFDPLPGGDTLDLDEIARRALEAVVQATPDDEPTVSIEVVDTLVTYREALLVLETTRDGDDAVAGRVHYIWLRPVFQAGEQVSWDVAGVYRSDVCRRGGGLDGTTCG